MGKSLDLVGKVFGRWKVIRKAGSDRHKNIVWLCLCECGTERGVIGSSLKSGMTVSCGCYQKERVYNKFRTHGQTVEKRTTAEYGIWASMKNRCKNESVSSWKNYGGRGIKVCERWMVFINFFNDMGVRPSKNHSIDRKNVDGEYSPENCIWSTKQFQERNKRVFKNSKSGVRGVNWDASRNKWIVLITTNGTKITVGRYLKLEDAIQARQEAELKYWKESS